MLNGATSNQLGAGLCGAVEARKQRPTRRAIDRAWRLALGTAAHRRKRRRSLCSIFAENPGDPTVLKELALDVFNLNAFLYVN